MTLAAYAIDRNSCYLCHFKVW